MNSRYISVTLVLCCVSCNLRQDITKACSLRGSQISQVKWNHYAGFYCYNYTNEFRLNFKYKYVVVPASCDRLNLTFDVPVAVNGSEVFSFDYKDARSAALLRRSFKSDSLFDNFVKCCEEAEHCCSNAMTGENIVSTAEYCPVVWDAWSCFPRTKVNTTRLITCSSQAYQNPDGVCALESRKDCLWNSSTGLAEWNQQTDYSTCAIAPVYLKRYSFHVIFLYVCIGCSLPAIAIFFAFSTFRETTRVILHRNLLIAIVVRNVLTILAKDLVLIDALQSNAISNHVMERNTVGCRVLAFFVSAATNSIYACMFVDGYYLHAAIVRSFAKEPRRLHLYLVVLILTLVPSIIWATIVGINGRVDCWMVDRHNEQWAVDGLRIVILLINSGLLLDIIRVMISKMKQGGPTRQTKAAFRATLFLIPLFGLHIFITAKKVVVDESCLAEDVYDYFRYSMEALQGIFVAVLFCYANREVHGEIRNALRKLDIHLDQKYGWSFKKTSTNRRRTTTATYVAPSERRDSF
ncbi:corticotropin-releasing factor receptor 2-like isoform X2 [Cylas formicarius]|uniref:corticotropin-releasing factor receptor 2-like isoform X2 n=1 Tax=Cylas formicarius TaxID=197179 RepID=UPI0029586546|nr:corticotropin-releasing factor receptor 2-like isoform X2 [Cylas formicarius]